MLKWLHSKAGAIRVYPAYLGRTLFPDTFFWAHVSYLLSLVFNLREYRARRKLSVLIHARKPERRIDVDDGYLKFHSDEPVLRDAIEACLRINADVDWEENLRSAKKPFLLAHSIDLLDPRNRAVLDLVTDDLLLAPVAEYIGSVPALGYAEILYSPNTHFEGRSQQFHMDGEDRRQIKCFIPLDAVDMQTGPLSALPAKTSRSVYDNLWSKRIATARNQKFPDEVIFGGGASIDEVVAMTGDAGTVAMVDTSRCYHFGSRPGNKPRLLLQLMFYSAFAKELPFWSRQYDERVREVAMEPRQAEAAHHLIGLQPLDFAAVRRRYLSAAGLTSLSSN